MYYFCTYFDKNYLDKGLALYGSLVQHCQPFNLFILCMDEEVYRELRALKLDSVTLISLSEFEWEDTKLAEAKQNRSLIEYYFTCTPTIILKLLQTYPSIDILTYLDADLYFFSAPEPLYEEMKGYSIFIVGHRFPEHLKHLERYGIYNVGLLSFRNDKNATTCLQWWRERCLEWCYDRAEDGKFADQKYLDDWPIRFPRVCVTKNRGVGIVPWNLADYKEEEPIIVYHFHDVRRVANHVWDTGISPYGIKPPQWVKDNFYVPYLNRLEQLNNNNTKKIRKTIKVQNYFKKVFYGDYIILMQSVER